MITRRGLFGFLAGAVAAPIVVRSGLLMPVKALIVPEPEEFVVTAITGEDTILTPTLLTREALRILHQKLDFEGALTRKIHGSFGLQVGDTIRFTRPAYEGVDA